MEGMKRTVVDAASILVRKITLKIPKLAPRQNKASKTAENRKNIAFNESIDELFSNTLLDFEIRPKRSLQSLSSRNFTSGGRNSKIERGDNGGTATARIPSTKTAELDPASKAVASILGTTKEGFLPYQFPGGIRVSPLEALKLRSSDKHVRLSVTKLLTKQWCELREFYQVYSGTPQDVTKQMERGSRIHKALENQTHPVIIDEKLTETLALPLPFPEDLITETHLDNISRLVSLLSHGEAREILAHSYLNRDTRTITTSINQGFSEKDLLVSGIIDYVKISGKDLLLFQEMQNYSSDIQLFVEKGMLAVNDNKHNYTLSVHDIKTRSSRSLPAPSVIQSAKLQVYTYRKFLGVLAEEGVSQGPNHIPGEFAYQMILENFRRRGANLDKPITPEHLLIYLRQFHIFSEDFKRLKNGEPIGFEPFDSWYVSNKAGVPKTDLSRLNGLDFEGIDLPLEYESLFTVWRTPLTLRYVAARAAQCYSLLRPLLSKSCSVQYIRQNGKDSFSEIEKRFEYQEPEIEVLFNQSLDFWLGKRDPIGVERSISGLQKCSYCQFISSCGYINEKETSFEVT